MINPRKAQESNQTSQQVAVAKIKRRMCVCVVLCAVFSARDQNQVLKEVDRERNSLDDLYYDAFSGQ